MSADVGFGQPQRRQPLVEGVFSLVRKATGLSSATLAKGMKDYKAGEPVGDRIRKRGVRLLNRIELDQFL